jgi:chemotaxis protein MotB
MTDLGDHDWLPVADLMSGVVGVVVLMLVAAMLKQQGQEYQQVKAEVASMEQQEAEQQRSLGAALSALATSVNADPKLSPLIEVNVREGIVVLRRGAFAPVSACLTPEVKAALRETSGPLKDLLEREPDYLLSVEGHTDNTPFGGRSIDASRCGLFDNNYALSAARAKEARDALVDSWPTTLASKVLIAGRGDAVPLVKNDTEAGRAANRRVIIEVQKRAPKGSTPSTQ